MRKLPYGANYLDWNDMAELKSAIDHKILFRYQTLGDSVATQFERAVMKHFGTQHALGVHNCTEALRLCLLSTKPKVGDVVYIPAVTFIAIAGAVLSCGLIPVMVDVDQDFSLDITKLPQDAERVIVAHMDGVVGKVPTNIPFVIEDTAQACGATHPDGRYAGSVGYAGVFSFKHNKMLTSGEGGLIITNNSIAWELMRKYHDHGSSRVHGEYPRWKADAFYGENFVTSEPIAAIQLQQLRHLDKIKSGLERGYSLLREQIPEKLPFRIMERKPGDVKISLRLSFETLELRNRLEELLREYKLPYWTLDRYFLPNHPVMMYRQSIYADGFPWNLSSQTLQTPNDFKHTFDRLARVICLTISPEVSEAEQQEEATAFVKVLKQL